MARRSRQPLLPPLVSARPSFPRAWTRCSSRCCCFCFQVSRERPREGAQCIYAAGILPLLFARGSLLGDTLWCIELEKIYCASCAVAGSSPYKWRKEGPDGHPLTGLHEDIYSYATGRGYTTAARTCGVCVRRLAHAKAINKGWICRFERKAITASQGLEPQSGGGHLI